MKENDNNFESGTELSMDSVTKGTPSEVEKITQSEAVAERERKKQTRKKIFGYALFILINAAVIIGMVFFEDLSGDGIAPASDVFKLFGENIGYVILTFSMYFVIIAADVIVFRLLTRKISDNCTIGTCVSVSFLGRYYDRITPWAMGGEPFQILYLTKNGLSTGDACAVTMSRHIIRFFSVAVAVITILSASRITTNIYVMIAAIASVLVGLIIPTFMLICSWKPKIGFGIGNAVIGLLCKIKLIKNKEKAVEKMRKNVYEFLGGLKFLGANKILILIIAICALTEMFAYNSVPFFVIKALGIKETEYFNTLVLCLFVNYASSFAPTPGGAGIAELSFYAIFASALSDSLIFWAVLAWRLAIFYIPVFIGFVMTVVSSIKKIAAVKRQGKTLLS